MVIGTVARAQANLQGLAKDLARAAARTDVQLRLRLLDAQRRAAADFRGSVEWLELVMADRVDQAIAAAAAFPRAVGQRGTSAAPARVVPITAGATGRAASRILLALNAAPAGLTKGELARRVRGDHGDFLRGLKELLDSGRVIRKGAGSRGRPFRYERGAAS